MARPTRVAKERLTRLIEMRCVIWRDLNFHSHQLEGLAIARSWGFESPLRTNNLRQFVDGGGGQLVK